MLRITSGYESCEHKRAFYYNQTKDEHEGRVYDLVYCPCCKSFWEDRVHMNKHNYPKGSMRLTKEVGEV